MTRLLKFKKAKKGGVAWINPEHVSSLEEVTDDVYGNYTRMHLVGGPSYELAVDTEVCAHAVAGGR